jgi:hypothetical protein
MYSFAVALSLRGRADGSIDADEHPFSVAGIKRPSDHVDLSSSTVYHVPHDLETVIPILSTYCDKYVAPLCGITKTSPLPRELVLYGRVC